MSAISWNDVRDERGISVRHQWNAQNGTGKLETMKFEWDQTKAESNVKKHKVTFDVAASVFLDEQAVSGPDPDHSIGESRYITFGASSLGRLLAVSHTYRSNAIRIISTRRITRSERKIYEES